MGETTIILLSLGFIFIVIVIFVFIIRWVLKINRIVNFLEVSTFLQLKIAQKLDALGEDDKKWIKDRLY